MLHDSLWFPPMVALLAALAWAAFWRWRKRPATAGLGLPIAVALGFAVLLGVMNASPRQLFERLPLLAVAALLLALPLCLFTRRWFVGVMTAIGALLCGWWMAGGPLVEADLIRAAPVVVTLALIVPLVMVESGGAWRGALASVALAAALWTSGVPGPWMLLAMILAAGALGQQVAGGGPVPDAARLTMAIVLTALLAGPVLARGAPADWAAALVPLAPLLLAARLFPRAKGWRVLVPMLPLAGLPGALAWWLARSG